MGSFLTSTAYCMFKKLLWLFLGFLMLLEPDSVLASVVAPADATKTETVAATSLFRRVAKRGRPNYKPYRGNSRHKAKKMGPLKRWKLRRKAQKKKRTTPSVKVGRPVRSAK